MQGMLHLMRKEVAEAEALLTAAVHKSRDAGGRHGQTRPHETVAGVPCNSCNSVGGGRCRQGSAWLAQGHDSEMV